PDNDRVEYIKAKAVELASGLGVDVYATGPYTDSYVSQSTVPNALGVTVWGQPDPNSDFIPDHASEQGLNVTVEVYYNVMMLDPIYAMIIPRGYVRLIGRVQMQNEGIDTVLGGQPPPSIDVTPDLGDVGDGDLPGGGDAIVYVNGQEDGVIAEAGSMIQVAFYSPNHCGELHDVYFDNVNIGTVSATSTPPCLSDSVVEYVIPVATEPGTHNVHFTLYGDTVVFDDLEVQVVRSSLARIETGGIRWPVGTTINIELYAHPGDSDIDLFIKPKGASDSDWEYIGTIHTNADGEVTGSNGLAYPITKSPGDYQLSSRPGTPGHDADITTELARTEIAVLEACLTINQSIVCGQAETVPAGARINIVLRNHAPGRTYSLYFVDRSLGTEVLINNVTTDQFGEGVAQYYIPFDQPNGSDLVESRDGDTVVATAEVIVSTPETPYIVIAGGDTWPAGSPITIQMQKHCDPPYDLYIGTGTPGSWSIEATIDTNLDTDAPPTCQRWVNYIIPPSYVGEYLIVSRQGNTDIAYANLTVELSPALTIDGGEFHVPGSPITIRLSGHVPSQNYSVYVVNLDTSEETLVAENFLPNASGAKTLTYNIPLAASGSYRVESRVYGTSEVVAHAPLTIQAADLEIVSLQVPSNLPLAQEFPVTVTVRNNAAFDIVGRSFDVDIYLDPSIPPDNPDSSLPPGDRKLWIASLGAGATRTVVGYLTIYGGSTHDLWARVDTSRRIAETDELNNFAHSIVSVPTECSMLLTDTFDNLDSA
ncbi:MAG: CARDB domain-containing protein, partial [Anaerolineae bacterium]